MGAVFVAATSEPDPEELESWAPVAHIGFGATYFFLYPAILQLRKRTGQLIDPQANAFFAGDALDLLDVFLKESRALASGQPPTWQQRVGHSSGEAVHHSASRADIIQLLDDLTRAASMARQDQMGILFLGE